MKSYLRGEEKKEKSQSIKKKKKETKKSTQRIEFFQVSIQFLSGKVPGSRK